MKKQKKVSPMHWPTQHLVLWRTTLDDVPLALIPDRKVAFAYANTVTDRDVDAAHSVMEIDRCSPTNISVVTFRNGRPWKFRVVRETFEFEDTPREPAKPWTDAKRKRVASAIKKAAASFRTTKRSRK